MRADFTLRVRATGRAGGILYLNSEADYRDQRALTIAVLPSAQAALRVRYGPEPDAYLRGRAIRVRGRARRVRSNFMDDGQPTGKYYYQTHVRVTDADQIQAQ